MTNSKAEAQMVISAGHCPLTGRYGILSPVYYLERAQPNDVWGTSAESQYWWSVTTQIWVVLLIGRAAWEIWSNQSEELARSGWWRVISMEFLRSFLRRHLAGKPVVASPNVGCFLRLPFSWYAWRTSFAPSGVKRFYSCPPSRPPWRPPNFFSFNSSNVGNSFLELNSKRLSKMKKAWKNIEFYMEKS